MIYRCLIFISGLFYTGGVLSQLQVSSPNGLIQVSVHTRDSISYEVLFNRTPLLLPSSIKLIISERNADEFLRVKNSSLRSHHDTIISPVPEKRKKIPDIYNELTIRFTTPHTLVFRVYDDGVAYRWKTGFKDSIVIKNELVTFNLPYNDSLYYPAVVKRKDQDIFHTSFEEPYQLKPVDSLTATNIAFTPVLTIPSIRPKLLITESDLLDYPGMFITGTGSQTLKGLFAPYPIEETVTSGEFPQSIVIRRADFIAKTAGSRDFPWRVLVIAEKDTALPATDIIYRLASPSKIKDLSWVKPGKGTDEWIIGINLFNVPFKAGINTSTYKFYIDFAKRFGFDRIMMDAGWSDYKDLFSINPNLNMEEIAAYAKQNNIRLCMWTLSITLERQLEAALQQFKRWGVDFIMTDFMDRDDQKMLNFYTKTAEACARYQIMITYHGAFKPAGFNRTYPHAITREGVLGSEYNIWSNKATPEHNVLLPFIRMVSGPMDYEPGLLDNATQNTFRPIGEKVMSIGTRCQQLAMFVVYESPIQIFSGNPSQGLSEPAFMELLGSIPTTWDETIIIDGKVGDFIITARRKGNDWFVGGMTDWTPREIRIPLQFIQDGQYTAEICRDGVNADRYASDYLIEKIELMKGDILKINMAPGGGFVVRLRLK